ncbi:unnamed protein product [Paramecium octaurelia]|uniref:Uncharacterized protein n=1 Tax=Paramecium octaurelia TaxID=43137 RepID=A0A8S1XRH2_PAROT|nr:unnamed protein product [Paramecium octaurelia]
MEKLIAGYAMKEMMKQKKQIIPEDQKFLYYGCWTTGIAVIAFMGHTTYLKKKYESNYLYQFQGKQYLRSLIQLYLPIICNQLLVSFCSNHQGAFLFSLSSIVHLYQYIMGIPQISYLSAAFTILGCILKFKIE